MKYVRIDSGTTKDEFIAICKKFADVLGKTNECDRIEFLIECLERSNFPYNEVWIDVGCHWVALFDDGDIAHMEEDEELNGELIVLPVPVRDEYFIVERGVTKWNLEYILFRIADEMKFEKTYERFEFVGCLLRDIPMHTYSYPDGSIVEPSVKFDVAIYRSGECLPLDLDNGTYWDSKKPIQGILITL
jgi:hypothetical protein